MDIDDPDVARAAPRSSQLALGFLTSHAQGTLFRDRKAKVRVSLQGPTGVSNGGGA